jgi:hypothetical protein
MTSIDAQRAHPFDDNHSLSQHPFDSSSQHLFAVLVMAARMVAFYASQTSILDAHRHASHLAVIGRSGFEKSVIKRQRLRPCRLL